MPADSSAILGEKRQRALGVSYLGPISIPTRFEYPKFNSKPAGGFYQPQCNACCFNYWVKLNSARVVPEVSALSEDFPRAAMIANLRDDNLTMSGGSTARA
jgi:hypothetical protein